MATENYKDFAETSIKEVNTPLFAKIGEHDKKVLGFVYFLSVLNILGGFMFFFAPIKSISDNTFVSVLISVIILLVIESISLISFQESIFAINNKKKYGYMLLIFASLILAFNVYSTAEGNRSFIRQLAQKPKEMNMQLSDTISTLDNELFNRISEIKNKYEMLNTAINREYSDKINQCEAEINQSTKDGKVIDWRKNHEATKNKSMLLNNWENQKNQLAENELTESRQLKTYIDSVKNVIYVEQKGQISEVVDTSDKSGQTAYMIGILLVFLIVIVRLIRVLSMIGASNHIKRTSGKIKTITNIHEIDLDLLKEFNYVPEKTEKTEKDKTPFEIIDNREVLDEKKHSPKVNGNGHNNNELKLGKGL